MVEFGENVYGLQNASQHYFQKPAKYLSLLESTFLVQLLPSPKKREQEFLQIEKEDRYIERMQQILAKLYEYEKISIEQVRSALIELPFSPWYYTEASQFYVAVVGEDESS